MRCILSICISLLMVMSLATVARGAQGLAAAWLFDEGSGSAVSDSVGNNNGGIQGNLTWVDGRFGKALEFPGQGDSYVTIPHADVFDSDPYTITAWIKLHTPNWQYLVWKNGTVWPEPHKKRHMDIWLNIAGNAEVMWHREDATEGRVSGTTMLLDDAWHHIAVVYDGSTVKLYVDGVPDGESDSGEKIVVNGEDPLWIGARPGNVAANGIIDEVGFFTTALSANDVRDVMTKGLVGLSEVTPASRLATTWSGIKVTSF